MLFLAAIALAAWLLLRPQPPVRQQAAQLRDLVADHFPVAQNVHLRFTDRGFVFPDLATAVQLQLDHRLKAEAIPYAYRVVDGLPHKIERPAAGPEPGELVLTDDDTSTATESTSGRAQDAGASSQAPEFEAKALAAPEYVVELTYSGDSGVWLDRTDLKAYVSYTLDNVHQNDLPYYLTQTVFDMMLAPDLQMWRDRKSRRFSDYRPALTVNFVAVEDSDATPQEVVAAFKRHMAVYESVAPFVRVVPRFTTVNVSKRRLPQEATRNTTSEVSFLYSTSLQGFADSVQGVPVHHIVAERSEPPQPGQHYGTEYEELLRKSQTNTYNVASFLESALAFVDERLHLPQAGVQSPRLKADAAMKHYTLTGIVEVLDSLLAGETFDHAAYKKVCNLVERILAEQSHEWSGHLKEVGELHRAIGEP